MMPKADDRPIDGDVTGGDVTDDDLQARHLRCSPARDRLRWRFLSAYGLAVFALALPIVRVVVDAPEFFIAHDLSRGETLLFAAAVVVVVPAALATLASVGGTLGRRVRAVVVAVLGAVAAAGVLQPLSGLGPGFIAAVGAAGIGVVVAERRTPSVTTMLGCLSVVALLLGVWFVGPSRTGAYLRSADAAALDTAVEGDSAPVIFLVLDEFPLTSILTRDLEINRTRFPNLAGMADTSDWYRLASSVSPQSSVSVPSLLSGVAPDRVQVPVSSAYPTNLFLQLGNAYDVHGYEPTTALCPASVCTAEAGAITGEDAVAPAPPSVLHDTLVVLGHAVGSDDMRDDLPTIDRSWAGFEHDAGLARADDRADVEPTAAMNFTAQRDVLDDMVGDLVDGPSGQGERPPLLMAHLLLPHMPWMALPDGTTYAPDEVAGLESRNGALAWNGAEGDRRTGYQRLLLQVGGVDRLIGELRVRLEQAGMWDDAAVVLVADHGTHFEQGSVRDIGAGGAEVTAVPLFVKAPHQQTGRVDDRAALTIDALPTLLAVLGVGSPSSFDGIDLASEDVPDERPGAFVTGHSEATPDQSLDTLRDVVERRARWIDPDTGWESLYQAGFDEAVVGLPEPADGADDGGTWSRAADETGGKVTLRLAAPAADPGLEVLYSCGDTVAGAVHAPEPDASGVRQFVMYVDTTICADGVDASLVYRDAGGQLHRSGQVR